MPEIISFSDVSFSYHPHLPILKSISFSVEKGEAVVLLGENGSGKSTLFLNLLHLVSGHSGTITAEGLEINHKNEKRIRKKIGLIFQNSNDQLFLPTVKEELAFGPWNLGFRGIKLEKQIFKAAEAIGIQSIMEKKVFHLSQGEKKKVAIAAVYAMDPDIYLFDEPFANLDPKTRQDLTKILFDLHSQGKTILLISHEVDQIPAFFKRVIVLHAGEILFDGKLRGLFQTPEILSKANLRVPIVATLYQKVKKQFPNRIKKSWQNRKIPISVSEFEEFLEFLLKDM
ncbi:MAG: energy-coupling factor ABC transporter ATP-binding protein [Candidatus Lokiarchaeota archaeon]|nr:energy-coupling factor ABC transporter ATP-binding protein [Candidatus Harpocratesius repetitus]